MQTAIASPEEVEQALRCYDSEQSAEHANRFFAVLFSEGFLDEEIAYEADSPLNTIDFNVWYWAAEWYSYRQQYKTAEEYGMKALPASELLDDQSQQADLYNLLAIANVRLGLFDEAAVYARKCYSIDLEGGDALNISSSLNLLAAIYMCARQLDEAEKYILEAIDYAERSGNVSKVALVKGTASEVYHRRSEDAKSLQYATEAYEIEKNLGRADKAAIRQAQRASSLICMGRYDEAEEALEKEAIPEFRKDGNLHSLAISCNQMGILKHIQGNDSAAVVYYNEALDIFTEQQDIFNQCQTHKFLQDALRDTDPAMALYHGDLYYSLRDSLYDSKTGMLLSQYAAEYDNYHLLQANEQLRNSTRRQMMLFFVVALVLVVLVPVLYVVSRRRYLRRQEKLMNEIALLQKQLKEAPVSMPQLQKIPDTRQPAESQASEYDRLFLQQLITVINDAKPGDNVSVEGVAERFNMTPQTFRRRIYRLTGELPRAFINAVHMQKAGAMLSGDLLMPVSEVAMLCGFDEVSTFSRSFKRFYGVSPTDYRKQVFD
ncbi:MAG: AraC family transcriptional regulator [Paludibacteraceae bacterium]|nr:AraC family transcriptional regulator [Paludibacteraceae bacterium]